MAQGRRLSLDDTTTMIIFVVNCFDGGPQQRLRIFGLTFFGGVPILRFSGSLAPMREEYCAYFFPCIAIYHLVLSTSFKECLNLYSEAGEAQY